MMRLIDADDLISRQAAINESYKVTIDGETFDVVQVETLLGLPTAERKGRWIDDNGLYRCSACGHLWSELWWTANCPIETMIKIMPYCPKCGARMEV